MAIISILSINAFAQEDATEPYPYTFVTGSLGGLFPHTDYKKDHSLKTAVWAISAGRYFNDIIGLRLQLEGTETKLGLKKENVVEPFHHLTSNVDIMFNLTSAFSKYVRPMQHKWDIALLVGGGARYAWDREDVVTAKFEEHGWHHNFNAGFLVDYNFNKNVALTFEALAKGYTYNWYNTALVGITWKFGRRAKKTSRPVAVTTPKEEEPQQLDLGEVKPAPIRRPQIEEPQVENSFAPVELTAGETVNIFFDLNDTTIKEEEQAKIDALKERMANRKIKSISIKGFADVQTGNAKINEELAAERAQKVAQQLGVTAKEAIQVIGDKEQPFGENDQNRAAIIEVVYE